MWAKRPSDDQRIFSCEVGRPGPVPEESEASEVDDRRAGASVLRLASLGWISVGNYECDRANAN